MNPHTLVFFQPQANFAESVRVGIKVVSGPEPTGTNQTAFAAQALAAGLDVVLKNPVAPLPLNCVGLLMTDDEVNEPKGPGWPKTAAMLQPEFDKLRKMSATLPIYVTLGGDKMVYDAFPSAADKKYYQDLAAMGDITFAIDFFPANRSDKYPMNFCAKACANLMKLTGKPCYAILETSDQQLKPPNAPETNSGPTPDQIKQQFDACVTAGVAGIWWFFTCQAAKYGWQPPGSWMPPVDRNNVSSVPQHEMVKTCNASLEPTPPAPPQPTDHERIEALERRLDDMVKAGARA